MGEMLLIEFLEEVELVISVSDIMCLRMQHVVFAAVLCKLLCEYPMS